MSEWIRIRVKDFYKDAVGELEYTYVTREVYEALVDTFRKEAHAQEMRDIRHTTKDGYTEGETEDLVELTGESVEDTVIRQMEIETLQKAMQSLTPVQRERLHFYFFEGVLIKIFFYFLYRTVYALPDVLLSDPFFRCNLPVCHALKKIKMQPLSLHWGE